MDTDALKASWAMVSQLGDQAGEIFYAVLFTAAPQLRAMFPPSMAIQREKLLFALGEIVSRVDDASTLTEFAAQLGRDHRRYGVIAAHYPIVGQAFLETLRRGLGPGWTPALAADWTAAYNVVAALMADAATEASRVSPDWWSANVTDVQRRSPEVTVFFVQPDTYYPYIAGQSLAVESPMRPRVWRYLSPANAMRADYGLEFHVRAVPGGSLSPALVYHLQKGDSLRLGPPIGTALTGYRHSANDLLLIAGGTGLAPLRAIVEALAARTNPPKVALFVGGDTSLDLYDLDCLRYLYSGLPWLTVVPTVANDPRWRGQHGSAVDVALRSGDWASHDVYLCGSPRMVTSSRNRLLAAGVPPGRIYIEDLSNSAYRGATGGPEPEV